MLPPGRPGMVSWRHMNQAAFDHIRDLAWGIPGINPDATAAHAMVESGYLRSQLATAHNNLWGVKASSSWQGEVVVLPTWEEVNGQRVDTTATFRAYPDFRAAVEDYADIIRRLYPFAADHAANPLAHLAGLFLTGPYKWATDSQAFLKSLRVLEAHGSISSPQARLGAHELIVDHSPSLAHGLAVLLAALSRKPVVREGPLLVTRTRRPDGTFKLDIRRED